MKVDIADSEHNLESTQRNGRRPEPSSAADCAAHEAAVAKAALIQSAADLKSSLAASFDVRRWAKAYPKTTLGVAVATGLVVAGGLMRRGSPTDRAKDAPPSDGEPKHDSAAPSASASSSPAPQSKLTASLFPLLLDLAKFLIETVVVAAIRSTAPSSSPPPPPPSPDRQP